MYVVVHVRLVCSRLLLLELTLVMAGLLSATPHLHASMLTHASTKHDRNAVEQTGSLP